jgi:hypothetical protein
MVIIYATLSRILGVKAQAKSPFVPLCERGISEHNIFAVRGLMLGLTSCGASAAPAQTEVCGYKDLDTDKMICQAGYPADPSGRHA